MPDRSRKRPRDLNQLAARLVDEATGGAPLPNPDEGKDPAAVALGRRGGLKGGKARAAKLTAEERRRVLDPPSEEVAGALEDLADYLTNNRLVAIGSFDARDAD